MTADVVVTDGGISSARIISSGSGFKQGDLLGIGTIGKTQLVEMQECLLFQLVELMS